MGEKGKVTFPDGQNFLDFKAIFGTVPDKKIIKEELFRGRNEEVFEDTPTIKNITLLLTFNILSADNFRDFICTDIKRLKKIKKNCRKKRDLELYKRRREKRERKKKNTDL